MLAAEPFNGAAQSFFLAYRVLPAQELLRFGNIGAAAFRIVDAARFEDDGRGRVAQGDDGLRKFKYGMFVGITEIDDLTRGKGFEHCQYQSLYQVTDVTDAARFAAVSIDGQGFVLQRLGDEVGNHAPIIGLAIGAIGVEDTHDASVELVLSIVLHGQGFAESFAFVIAGSRPDGVHIAPVVLALRVYQWIAIGFRGRGEQKHGVLLARLFEHHRGSSAVDQNCFDGMLHIANRAGRTRHVIDGIRLKKKRLRDIVM